VRARSLSHAGITVSSFNRAVQFYWDVFGAPVVGVSDTPSERVHGFFGVDAPEPTCTENDDVHGTAQSTLVDSRFSMKVPRWPHISPRPV